jgi:hypothetical protein
MFFSSVLVFHFLFDVTLSATYDFNISWVNAKPDGLVERPVMAVNGVWREWYQHVPGSEAIKE